MSGMKRLAEQLEPDLFGSKAARDEALAQVSENSGDFMVRGYKAVQRLPQGLYTGESIRLELTRQGIEPHHPNAWGAMINKCVRDGLLRKTGRWLPMRVKRSHARQTPEYMR